MTTNSMTHEQFEALLPAFMEGELRGDERDAFDAHAADCAECGPLVRDLEQIVARAATLGPIEPPASVWSGIESRLGATVVPLASRRRFAPVVRNLAAAAVLVAVTAGITWKLARNGQSPNVVSPSSVATVPAPATGSATRQVANADASGSTPQPGSGGPIISQPPQFATSGGTRGDDGAAAPRTTRVPSAGAQLVADGRLAAEDKIYDREITRLRTVLRQRRGDLDPRTVMAIEKSLAVIDTAIAQARSALAADPASRFLTDRLTNALDKKVELLRTAALLPARS
ncbi:MAG TPA: zf-HC2 domain-containing protein [Gemmatimonadaceae bacterium]